MIEEELKHILEDEGEYPEDELSSDEETGDIKVEEEEEDDDDYESEDEKME